MKTERRKEMSSGEDGAADHFQRLPDDVVLVIFNKLWDAKLLGRCSTVCKRFASLTPRVGNVFLSLLPLNRPSFRKKFVDYWLNFFRKPPPNHPKPPKKPPSPFDIILLNLNISLPLSHFEDIRHLRLQLPPYSDAVVGDDYFIWGATKPGPELGCFALLALRSLEYEESEELETPNVFEITRNEFDRRFNLLIACLTNALRIRWLMAALIRTNPELESISINDTNELGVSHCVNGESLAELKELVESKSPEMLIADITLVRSRICNLPLLRLPVSGGIMEGVTLIIIGFGDGGGGGGGCSDAAVVGCFEEDDDIFREAVAEILTKHKDEVFEFRH